MNEYADFVAATLQNSNSSRVARQKELEKRIRMPFKMSENKSTASKAAP
jgi:hypothetical protein